ncbi:TraE/TraK family type IV conjugative transfer system protein [Galenea microaerophila]
MAHSSLLINTSKSKKAWQFSSIVLAVVCLFLGYALIKNSNNTKVVILPYSAINQNKPVSVTGKIKQDAAYLSLLADADLSLLLNWTPKTIDQRFELLKTRLSPLALSQNQQKLEKDIDFYKTNNISEVFFATKKSFQPPNKVIVSGVLTRFAGGKPLKPINAKYKLTYSHVTGGIYVIDSIEVLEDEK